MLLQKEIARETRTKFCSISFCSISFCSIIITYTIFAINNNIAAASALAMEPRVQLWLTLINTHSAGNISFNYT